MGIPGKMAFTTAPIYRAMLGALVGDAAGAHIEFMDADDITPELVQRAMRMPGGGPWGLGPGQITDDGELTLAAWRHIAPYRDGIGIPTASLVRAYVEWFRSRPFDIGWTCKTAFITLSKAVSREDIYEPLDGNAYHEAKAFIRENNMESEANGALMRATALATWAAVLPDTGLSYDEDIAEFDAAISHPSLVCQEVNKIYVKAIVHFLRGGGSPQEVLAALTEYVSSDHITSQKVKSWFFEESLDISELDCGPCSGHVRYGFVMAMHFLRNPAIGYEEAISRVLLKGGDTDTNACIVGGLVACYQPIPEYMSTPVLAFDCSGCAKGEGRPRPAEYSVRRVLSTEYNVQRVAGSSTKVDKDD